MSRVIVHIGTHKTATTTVQDTFYANADLLAQHGLIYPTFRKHTGHHGLVAERVGLGPSYHLPEGGLAALSQIAATYGDTDQTVFLSSEEFSRGQDGKRTDMALLRGLLDPFDEIEVICVLRDQWHFLQSIYLEISKSRRPPPPGEIVAHALNTRLWQGLWIDYGLLYDHLVTGFDPHQIRLIDFAACTAHCGGIIGYMLDLIGTDLTFGDLDLVNDGASNRSPLSLAMWAGHFLNEPNLVDADLIALITDAFRVEYGEDAKSCLFTRAEAKRINEFFRPLNKDLASRIAQMQPGFALAPSLLTGNTIFREDISATFWMRCARRILHRSRAIERDARA